MNGNLLDPFLVDLTGFKLRQPRQFKLERQGLNELILVDRPEPDQNFSQAAPFVLLNVQGFEQFCFGQGKFVFEDSAKKRASRIVLH